MFRIFSFENVLLLPNSVLGQFNQKLLVKSFNAPHGCHSTLQKCSSIRGFQLCSLLYLLCCSKFWSLCYAYLINLHFMWVAEVQPINPCSLKYIYREHWPTLIEQSATIKIIDCSFRVCIAMITMLKIMPAYSNDPSLMFSSAVYRGI